MSRAQASVELLLVALIVLAGSIAIASYYTNINDSVTATALLKVKVVENAGKLDYFVYIDKVKPTVTGSTISFDLYLKSEKSQTLPEWKTALHLDGIGGVEQFINDKTNFDTVVINPIQSA